MEFKDSVKLLGDFHHIEISPTATIELGTDVTLRSFISLEVSDNAKLLRTNRESVTCFNMKSHSKIN